MQDIMLDLETMGSGPNAAIVAIGAIEMDLERHLLGERFYAVVDLASSIAAGGVMDPSTVLWWMRQSDDARQALLEDGEPIETVLQLLADWLGESAPPEEIRIWGNGAAFDNVILAEAYRRLDMEVPWKFWHDRCYRTLKAQHPGVPAPNTGTKHNAIDDAERQALHLLAIQETHHA